MQKVDTLIITGWVIPVLPEGEVLENHAVAITAGRISAILPASRAGELEAAETLEMPEHALLPGLVNCHGHAAMSLLRGYADDLALMPWLTQHVWPLESQHVSEEFVQDGVNLALAEMLRSGTTCFSDMYFFPNITAEMCLQAGMRAQITFPVFDFPSAWGTDADDYISKGLTLRDDYKHSELLSIVFGPHSPYTVSRQALEKIAMLAAELDLPVHIHLHETAAEVTDAVALNGERPLQTLADIGLIGPRTQCVHMTELEQTEMELLAVAGASVIHCPESNMKLASGSCPVAELQAAGVNVALGTDSAASNNDLNMFGEMRTAALLAKLSSADATALPAARALSMATICGARAIGMQDQIGSLEIGKQADLIAVDLSGLESQPLYNVISQLVYATHASQVTHSWVAGRNVMSERLLTALDAETVKARAQHWGERISAGRKTS
ncbi:MAG: TRZ/ATZ family hydrolase [Gammaproteobacteria bacterium]|nr:TRZ/ATZ family hydrolase [Gammaproteobacteria bacterium]